jgi:hypothetical protein
MIRKARIIGIAVVAVLALSAVVASAASANTFMTKNSVYPQTVEGSQSTAHVFTVTGQKVTCKTAKFKGTATAASSTQEVHPTYEGCTAFGFEASVTTTGCNYLFHLAAGGSGSPQSGTVDIVCETGKSIVINAGFGTCEATVGAQTGLGGQTFTNTTVGGVEKIIVGTSTTGITTNVTKSSFPCPLSTGLHNTANGDAATYTGETLVGTASGEGITVQ